MAGYPENFKKLYWQCNAGVISRAEFRKQINLPPEEFDRYYRTYDAEQLFKNEAKNIEKEQALKEQAGKAKASGPEL